MPLVSPGQLSRLSPLPASCPPQPARWGSVGKGKGLEAVQAPPSHRQTRPAGSPPHPRGRRVLPSMGRPVPCTPRWGGASIASYGMPGPTGEAGVAFYGGNVPPPPPCPSLVTVLSQWPTAAGLAPRHGLATRTLLLIDAQDGHEREARTAAGKLCHDRPRSAVEQHEARAAASPSVLGPGASPLPPAAGDGGSTEEEGGSRALVGAAAARVLGWVKRRGPAAPGRGSISGQSPWRDTTSRACPESTLSALSALTPSAAFSIGIPSPTASPGLTCASHSLCRGSGRC